MIFRNLFSNEEFFIEIPKVPNNQNSCQEFLQTGPNLFYGIFLGVTTSDFTNSIWGHDRQDRKSTQI